MRLAAILVVVALLAPARAQQQRATIAGCVTDMQQRTAGTAWIAIAGGGTDRRIMADPQGCYRVDLPPGSYRVRAAVPGFCDGIRDDVVVAPGDHATVNLALAIAPMAEKIMYAWLGWPDVVARADAILHLRVERVMETHAWPVERGCASTICTEMAARTLSAVRTPDAAPIAPAPMRFLWCAALQPYPLLATPPVHEGDEFVAFLQWIPGIRRLALTDAGLLVPVRDSRISFVVGMDRTADGRPVNAFLGDLRKLSAQKKR